MTGPRPVAMIRRDLDTALAYRERYRERSSDEPHVLSMRRSNDEEITSLEAELADATSSDVEFTFLGSAYDSHTAAVPYVARVLDSFQATFRAAYRSTVQGGRLKRGEATLALAATTPGSFKLQIKTPSAQLDLLSSPGVDQAMQAISGLLEAAADGTAAAAAAEWASRSEEPAVRAMIRLAVALASAEGATVLRWNGITTTERLVQLHPENARDLAIALAGQTGREVITVVGHLEMGQDQPPRVRIRTADDDYLARVTTDDMLDKVKTLIFGEVSATLVIDMRTSPTTGNPESVIELLDIEPV